MGFWLSHYFEAWPGGGTEDVHTLGRWEDCVPLLVAPAAFFPPSDHHRCYIAGATSQRPLLPQIWKHMKRAMTHGLQLFQLLDTSPDRLSSHVCITLRAAWRGKGSVALQYSASRGSLTHGEILWRGRATDAVLLLESMEGRAEVLGGYRQTLRGMAFAVFLNLALQTVKESLLCCLDPTHWTLHISASIYLLLSFAVGLPLASLPTVGYVLCKGKSFYFCLCPFRSEFTI